MEARTAERPARVFISYRHPDSGYAEELLAASRAVDGLELYSFPYGRPESESDWREIGRKLIGDADVLLCLVGPTTAQSPHVTWELDEASKRGIPIVLAGPGAPALARQRGGSGIEAVADRAPEKVFARLRPSE
jgi:MTH538 TIR-like domain (DUF1863)